MLKLFGGRKGGATRGGRGGSHTHKQGKRLCNKAIRKEGRAKSTHVADYCELHGIPYIDKPIAKQIFEDMQGFPMIEGEENDQH